MRSKQERCEHARQVPRSDLLVKILPGHRHDNWSVQFSISRRDGRTALICGRSTAVSRNGTQTLQILQDFCVTRTGIGETRYEAGQDFETALYTLAEEGNETARFFTILHPLIGHAVAWTREEVIEKRPEGTA